MDYTNRKNPPKPLRALVLFAALITLLIIAANVSYASPPSRPPQRTTAQSSTAPDALAPIKSALPKNSKNQRPHPGPIPAAPGPRAHRLVGWRSKNPSLREIGIDKVHTPNFPASISSLIGYHPFQIKTRAGRMDLKPGMQNRLRSRINSPVPPDTDQLCVIIPALPVQNKIADHLKNQGVKIIRTIRPNGYVAKAAPQNLAKLPEDPLVYWVGEIPWNLKIDPLLAQEFALPGPQNQAVESCPIDKTRVWLTLYDKNDKIIVQSKIETEGLLIERYDRTTGSFLCRVFDADRLVNLANMPEVCFIQPPGLVAASLETSVALCGRHDIIRDSYNFGNDIIIGLIDSGFEIDHTAFMGQGPYPILYALGWNVSGRGAPADVWNDNSIGHGTHVAGIMLSRWQDVNLDGMAPQTAGDENHRLRVVRCGRDTGDPLALYNVDQAMGLLADDNESLTINCSWGANDNTGSDFISVLADAYVWQKQQIYVVAAGNDGTAAGSIDSPASAKNTIAVGNLDNPTLALEYDSGNGPTRDGRQKPDIYAPGRFVTSADAANLNGSVNMGGTSMAAPHVTGFLATLLGHYPDFQRRPALAKAYIMAAAQRQSSLPPRTGVLNSYDAHWSSSHAHAHWSWFDDDPRPYDYVYFDLNGLPDGVAEMYVVLTWIEPECFAGDFYTVYNDVDLYVDHGKDDGPLGEWASTSAYDNVEFVKITNPPPGDYRIKAAKYSALTDYRLGYAVWCTLNAEVPIAPSNLSHSGNSTHSITWTWIDNSNNEDGFHLQNPSHQVVAAALENASSYTEPNLSVNTQYTRHLHAFNAAGQSNPSNSFSAYTSIETPSGIAFGPVTSHSISARSVNTPSGLDRANSGLIVYNLTDRTDSGLKQDNDFWLSTSLSANTQYGFTAQALNGDGDQTDYGDTTYKFTLANPPAIAPFSHITQTGMQVNWSANNNPPGAEYLCQNITRGTNSGWTTMTHWIDAGLNDSTTYHYQVKARNGEEVETENIDLGFQCTLPPPSIIYVDANASAGANDGSGWHDAFTNLPDALNAARYGDEIRVGKGAYKPNPAGLIDPRQATFQPVDGVTIRGGYAGFNAPDPDARDPHVYQTVLSGDLAGNDPELVNPWNLPDDPCRVDNCYHVVWGGGAYPHAVLDGFTITAGNANGDWRLGHDKGGGIFQYDGLLTNCIFYANSAVEGGGIFQSDGPVNNCIFSGNFAARQGGAIYWCHGPLDNCTFQNNAATGGGGIYANLGPLSHCTFSRNTATSGGGILICFGALTHCTFSGNLAYDIAGAIYWGVGPVTNCIFNGNKAKSHGGGIYRNDGPVTNCTFCGNAAAENGGGIYQNHGPLTNCILWGNLRHADGAFGGPYMDQAAQICLLENDRINYCCVQGWTGNLGGLGNINENPLFVDPGYWNLNDTPDDPNDDFWVAGDYHLQSIGWRWNAAYQRWDFDKVTSRCLDAGHPGFDLGGELLSVPTDPHNAWGENLRINMGAYGGASEAAMPPYGWALPADLNNDGIVNLEDYAQQAFDWLKTDNRLPGDINRDKTVNILDLALLLQQWLQQTAWR